MSLLVSGWVQRTVLGKDLSGEHLIASPRFANRTTAFVKLDRSRGGALLLVLVPVLMLLILIHRVVLAGYHALAGFPLAGDDGRIGREDERRRGLLGLFDLGGQPFGRAALGTDPLLVLLPEPGGEYEGPYRYHGRARDDGGDYGGFRAVACFCFRVEIGSGGERKKLGGFFWVGWLVVSIFGLGW